MKTLQRLGHRLRGHPQKIIDDAEHIGVRIRGNVSASDVDWVCACIATAGATPVLGEAASATTVLTLTDAAPGVVRAGREIFQIPEDTDALLDWLAEDLFAPPADTHRICITHQQGETACSVPWFSWSVAEILGPGAVLVDATVEQALSQLTAPELAPNSQVLGWNTVNEALLPGRDISCVLGLKNSPTLGSVSFLGSGSDPEFCEPATVARLVKLMAPSFPVIVVDAGTDTELALQLNTAGFRHLHLIDADPGPTRFSQTTQLLSTRPALGRSLGVPALPQRLRSHTFAKIKLGRGTRSWVQQLMSGGRHD